VFTSAAGRRSDAVSQSRGSTERLSPPSARRSGMHCGSVSGIDDRDTLLSRSTAVAKYSSSVASDINALSQRAGSGRALSTVDDDDNDEDLTANAVKFCYL